MMYHCLIDSRLRRPAMLAYAAHRRSIARGRPAPHALLVIIVAHIALIAAVMSARMEMPEHKSGPTEVDLIPIEPPPPPQKAPKVEPKTAQSTIDRVPVIVPVPRPIDDLLDPTPIPFVPDPVIQPGFDPQPTRGIAAKAPVRVAARFATPDSALRPPYPPSKLDSGQEAKLRLRLSIDERGRVTAVEPVGQVDPAFLAAARRHLLARWRYQPATEDGRAVASSTLITLRFELEQ
jgi:protein TonB